MISYAQNFEDVVLARAFAGQATGFYIDVGAWHPVTDSVTKHFYDLGWRGVIVEPVAEYVRLFRQQRPRDVHLELALGSTREQRTLYHIPGTGLSTLRGSGIRDLDLPTVRLEERAVQVTTLAETCEQHVGGAIDFLKIDVEGWEEEVIRGGDWSRFRPRVLLLEAVEVDPSALLLNDGRASTAPRRPTPCWQSWEPLVLAQGYEPCLFDGLNRFYVRREDHHLAAALSAPANVFDRFVPWQLANAEEARRTAEVEVQKACRRIDALEHELASARQVIDRLTHEVAELGSKLSAPGSAETR